MKRTIILTSCFFILSCQSRIEKENSKKTKSTNSSIKEYSHKNSQDTFFLNNRNYFTLGKKNEGIKVVKKKAFETKPPVSGSWIFYGEDILLLEEHIDPVNIDIYRKYNPRSKFEDYQVEIYNGKLAEPDFSTNVEAKKFETRIKNECANGINFAGHYTLVYWGCGTNCASGVIVDRRTGRIFSKGVSSTNGLKFKKNSLLLIRNEGAINKQTNLIWICSYCVVSHEVWRETKFEVIE